MSRINQRWAALSKDAQKAIIPYITPEFPLRDITVPLVHALEQAGADFMEIGIPFSDPLADGPTIQHSSSVALKNGVTLKKVLSIVSEIRTKSTVPILLMGYINPLLRFGLENFFMEAQTAGVDGLILADLPPEESSEVRALSRQHNISNVFLIAPTSSDERIQTIDSYSTDFSYCVSVTGVTGTRENFEQNSELLKYLSRVKASVSKPFVVGFGISKPEHFKAVCEYADGAVVGSALIERLDGAKTIETAVHAAGDFLREFRNSD